MFNWVAENGGFQAEMPGNVTLVVTPDRYAKGLQMKPAREAMRLAESIYQDVQP